MQQLELFIPERRVAIYLDGTRWQSVVQDHDSTDYKPVRLPAGPFEEPQQAYPRYFNGEWRIDVRSR